VIVYLTMMDCNGHNMLCRLESMGKCLECGISVEGHRRKCSIHSAAKKLSEIMAARKAAEVREIG
jgi:hypothetical protein